MTNSLDTVRSTDIRQHIADIVGSADEFDIEAIIARTYRYDQPHGVFVLTVAADAFWEVVRECALPPSKPLARLRAAVAGATDARRQLDAAMEERDAAITAARDAGVPVSAITAESGLSRPAIYKILKE
ncbi:hypothetical protein GS531_23295 [Rhodococcus hoagii]|nr:hypothetical protein [Prescottella equi]